MSSSKIFIGSIAAIVGALTLYTAVADFNQAKTWLEFFRSLFWMLIGSIALHSGLTTFNQGFEGRDE